MSIANELLEIDNVLSVSVKRDAELNGERAVKVVVTLDSGKTVEGVFAVGDNTTFGGVEFNQNKDIAALMTHKIKSVTKGTHEV